ncbi:uncharacterized protein SAPINGB_P003904 [Magnusiomyces paraingens]|uniref:FAD-binding FR-type domain-containing protein n=1 Tax=Magnusiomyces paraingens TaxID=2606893 RepID=A0A5E8BZ67_9ASCO|nr:uncharacterized protein SAPINGB_P003904 [Saprochaete ingens]VVT54095.1 unnamed protein product [Saprochaete ingens]
MKTINAIVALILYFSCFSKGVLAYKKYYVYMCQALVNEFNLDCGNSTFYECRCKSSVFMPSLIRCLEDYNLSEKALSREIDTIIFNCNEYGYMNVTTEIIEEIYEENKDQFITVEEFGTNLTAPLTKPIIMPEYNMTMAYKSINMFYWQLATGENYGGIILSYWCGVFLIAIAINFIKKAAPHVFLKMNSPVVIKFRQMFVTPATFGFKHSIPIGCFKNIIAMATPTRAQSLIVFGYLTMCLILGMIKYEPFEPNIWFPDQHEQLIRYIADRTGIMSTTQIPPIFLFAGRNNLLQWLTGWSFDTFNVYHRWVARVMVFYAFMHSVCYTWLERDWLSYEFQWRYWRWGVVATITCCIMLGQSIFILRSKFYEFFLLFHIALAVFFVIGMWYHIVEMGWMNWMYSTIAIWGFDRAVRLGRLIWSGVGTSQTKIYPNDIFKMTIDYSKRWKAYPGSYVYVHILRPWGFWESHPFTVYQSALPENEGKLMIGGTVKEGMTKKIAKDLTKAGGEKTIKVLIDGPYGACHDVARYDTVIFVCGGIGVTSGLSYTMDIIKNKYHDQHLIFLWVTRHQSSLDCFEDEFKFLAQSDKCDVEIYLTSPDANSSDDSCSDNEKKLSDTGSDNSNSRYSVIKGQRPDVATLLPTYISQSKGTTAVMVCGPPTLNDLARRTVTDNLGTGNGRVDYFEEAFSW